MSNVTQGLVFQARAENMASPQMRRMTQGLQRMADRARRTGMSLQNMANVVTVLNQGFEILQRVVGGAIRIISESSQAALEQREAFDQLRIGLEQAGVVYEDYEERFAGFAAELQRTTLYGDDATAAAMGRIAGLTAEMQPSIEALEEYTMLAQDLATFTKRDLDSAARIIGRAAAGDVEVLTRELPAYRDAFREIGKIEDASERAAEAMAILREEFGGAAQEVDPMRIAISRLNDGLGDAKEAFGEMFLGVAEDMDVFNRAANAADLFAQMLSNADGEASALGQSVKAMAETAVNAMFAAVEAGLTAFTRLQQAQNALESGMEDGRANRQERLANIVRRYGRDGNVGAIDRLFLQAELSALDARGVGFLAGGVVRGVQRQAQGFGLDDLERMIEQEGTEGAVSMLMAVADRSRQRAQDLANINADLEVDREQLLAELRGGGGGGGSEGDDDATWEDARQAVIEMGRRTGADIRNALRMLEAAAAEEMERQSRGRGGGGGGGFEFDRAAASVAFLEGQNPMAIARAGGAEFSGDVRVYDRDQEPGSTGTPRGAFQAIAAEPMAGMGAALEGSLNEFPDDMARFNNEMLSAMDNAEHLAESLQGMKEDGKRAVGDLAAGFAVDLSEGIAEGSLSMDEMAKSMLKNLETMARGIGATYIATGIPLLFPGPLARPASGLAYIKWGSVLLAGSTILGALNGGGGGGGGARGASDAAGAPQMDSGMRSQGMRDEGPQTTLGVYLNGAIVTRDEGSMTRLLEELGAVEDMGEGRL